MKMASVCFVSRFLFYEGAELVSVCVDHCCPCVISMLDEVISSLTGQEGLWGVSRFGIRRQAAAIVLELIMQASYAGAGGL